MYIRKILLTLGIVIVASALVTMVSANGGLVSSSSAQGEQKFTAKMTGKEEVPPKDTKATGDAEFTLSADGKTMSYKVNVMNMDKVTMAHIHQGKVGENGPPVVWLFNSSNPTGPKNGMLSQGNITSNDLVGPLKGKQMSDLVKLINDGQAYANVHTQPNPKGEIRGQLSK
ncbi:MAG TPA: CHRD domain-containing protein [Nitrososphaeraceae archaeon]|jgi:short-subunit dehydrogenase